MPPSKPNRSRLAVAVAVASAAAFLIGVAWGFGQQLSLGHQMRLEEQQLEYIVATEQARHEELVAELEYVRSDEYVERWAREEARMVRPGEVPVVVVPEPSAEPSSDAQPTPTPQPPARPFWVELWELIVGRPGQ